MPLATLIHRASLPSPQVSAEQALELLQEHYGLGGRLQALGSQQDLNYRVDSDQGRFVLKICRGDYSRWNCKPSMPASNIWANTRMCTCRG
jgi:Ser/Thr protein kinase RdoA (MazF antagonist)